MNRNLSGKQFGAAAAMVATAAGLGAGFAQNAAANDRAEEIQGSWTNVEQPFERPYPDLRGE